MARQKHKEDELDNLHEYGVHIGSRTIFLRRSDYFDGDQGDPGVDHVLATKFLKNLLFLETLSQDPITIILSTPGGDIYEAMAIFDAISQSPCQITIVVMGQACSAGSYILQAADKRVMSENAILMVHMGSVEYAGHPKSAKNWAIFEDNYGIRMDELLKEKIVQKCPEFRGKKFEELMNFDTIMDAKKALDMGLIDEIKTGS